MKKAEYFYISTKKEYDFYFILSRIIDITKQQSKIKFTLNKFLAEFYEKIQKEGNEKITNTFKDFYKNNNLTISNSNLEISSYRN